MDNTLEEKENWQELNDCPPDDTVSLPSSTAGEENAESEESPILRQPQPEDDGGLDEQPEGEVGDEAIKLAENDEAITVFTTRPDTLFGATYMVLAPEHQLVEKITTPEQMDAVNAYVEAAIRRSERDRVTDVATKTGVFTGAYAINPVNQEKIPVWISDYVLARNR